MRPLGFFAAVALSLAVPSASADAQCDTTASSPLRLAGQVVDVRALTPVPFVAVIVRSGTDTVARLESDSAGFFSGNLCPRATYTAHFSRAGYRADSLAVALDSAHWAPLDVAMMPTGERPATTLAATRVTATRTSTIEARARRSNGIFIGPAEIERIKPARASDLLRGRRGIAIESRDGVLDVVSAKGRNVNLSPTTLTLQHRDTKPPADSVAVLWREDEMTRATSGVSCKLLLGVDGVLMADGFNVDEVPAQTIIALEIYSGVSTIPVEFRATRAGVACGLVMIWTRTGTPLR
jgi:hypothetical protein